MKNVYCLMKTWLLNFKKKINHGTFTSVHNDLYFFLYSEMANLITVRLQRSEGQPWGFRLQGGKDFGTPLVLQKVSDLSRNVSGVV